MIAEYYFGATDIWTTYGMFPPDGKGFFGSLFKAPEVNFGLTKNWADQNGTQRALTQVTYNPRDLDLTFVLAGASKGELLDRYNLFKSFILANQTFTFKCVGLDRLFTLQYKAMPSFTKLSQFNRQVQGNEMICVEFALSVRDNVPTVYKNATGATIALTFPAPSPSVTIDLNAYTFALVGDSVIMSGAGIGIETLAFNGNDIGSNYGLNPKDEIYGELMKLPEAKELPNIFQSRVLELPFYLVATSETQFFQRYYSLLGFLLDNKYFTLDIVDIKKRFTMLYSGMSSLNQLSLIKGSNSVVAELVITCLDDSPTQEGGLGLFDGRFRVDANGDLIYTQANFWDSKFIPSLVVDGENRNLIITTV